MLEDAVRLGHLTANPWKHVRHRAGDPSERRAHVPVPDVERVIEYCPNEWWRLLVALARFGGLRIPSEALSLTWGDVDWERMRLTIPSPKTEGAGKPHRVIPLFPLLRPHLEAAFENAAEGSIHIFPENMCRRASGPMGWGGANLRTTFAKIVRRAGVEPWPRLWHSLRASCESDLAQSFPLATVTK
jgi:integrase